MDTNNIRDTTCKTLTVTECAEILGISRAAAYAMAAKAEKTGEPFRVVKFGRMLRVSARSFDAFCQASGLE